MDSGWRGRRCGWSAGSKGSRSCAPVNHVRHAPSDGGAQLAQGQAVERELEDDVHEAEREENCKAEGVIVEIESRRPGACRDHKGQSCPWYVRPADHVRFDEPVE